MKVTRYWTLLPNLMISLCVVPPAFAQDAKRTAKDSDAVLVHRLIEAIKLLGTVAAKQHASKAIEAPPVLCPAALVGTWIDEKGPNDGVLAVEKDSIRLKNKAMLRSTSHAKALCCYRHKQRMAATTFCSSYFVSPVSGGSSPLGR